MKVLFLAPSLEVGGAERQLVCLANGLSARGHEVGIALFRATGPMLGELYSEVRVHGLKKGGKADIVGFLSRTLRLFRAERPDVVYSFLGVPNLVTALLKPLLRPETRVAWTVRSSDMDLHQFGRLARACAWLEALLSFAPDTVVANSEAGRRHALKQGFPARRLIFIPNGIDTNRFRPDRAKGRHLREQWQGGDKDILVGIVARFDPMKDHPTFLQAARKVIAVEDSVRFVCVGSGPLEARLRALQNELGLMDRVVFAGTHADMPAVYNALDICCLSSVSEGFPNALGEAMACGVPCVTTDVGDAALLVGDTGLTVPRRDPQALAGALLTMAERVRTKSLTGTRAHILERFSLERMLELTEQALAGTTP